MEISRIFDYYILEALSYDLRDVELYERGLERLQNDVEKARLLLTENLAQMLYDYCALISYGEARHAGGRTWLIPQLAGTRESVYETSLHYDPQHPVTDWVMKKVFNGENWSSGTAYGGKKWLIIWRSLQYYHKWPKGAYIDYVVDLAHNGGLIFNKNQVRYSTEIIIDKDVNSLQSFLDFKKEYDLLRHRYRNRLKVAFKTMSLVQRWETLRGKETQVELYDTGDGDPFRYNPIEWNGQHLTLRKRCGRRATVYCNTWAIGTPTGDILEDIRTEFGGYSELNESAKAQARQIANRIQDKTLIPGIMRQLPKLWEERATPSVASVPDAYIGYIKYIKGKHEAARLEDGE